VKYKQIIQDTSGTLIMTYAVICAIDTYHRFVSSSPRVSHAPYPYQQTNNNNQTFYSQASYGRLEMKHIVAEKQKTNKGENQGKIKHKGEKGNIKIETQKK
jgi:hypothetical protein